MPELERLKMDQDMLKQQYAPVHHNGTVQITTSNLPELHNWGTPTPASRAPPQRPEDDFSRLSLVSSGDLLSDSFPAPPSAPPPVRLAPCPVSSLCVSSSCPLSSGRAAQTDGSQLIRLQST